MHLRLRAADPARRSRVAAALVLTATVLLSSSACAVLDQLDGPDAAQRDQPDGQITAEADADVFSVRVGDCIDSSSVPDEGDMDAVHVVPCEQSHDSEIYAEKTFDEGDFPGEDTLGQMADTFCYDSFAAFVGVPYEESSLEYWPITPTKDGWEQIDDRVVQCVLESETPVQGGLAGSRA